MREAVGAVLADKYRLRSLLGSGGMGAVFEGEHLDLGKRIAVKLIAPEFCDSAEVAARFRREARAAGRVESEHIVQIFDVGRDATHGLYLVMEYLSGEDLSQRLDRTPLLETPLAVHIAHQTARGLGRAHDAGVIHRDLKPANIFLCARGGETPLVKIVDFGISKLREDVNQLDGGRALTKVGAILGTCQYMSPEQAAGELVDASTDVWSLGAVLYEMLAGQPAYDGNGTVEQVLVAVLSKNPKPLSQIAPWVPFPIAAVVAAAMERDRSHRIPDAGTFARRLAEAAGDLPLERSGLLRIGPGFAGPILTPSAHMARAPVAMPPTAAIDRQSLAELAAASGPLAPEQPTNDLDDPALRTVPAPPPLLDEPAGPPPARASLELVPSEPPGPMSMRVGASEIRAVRRRLDANTPREGNSTQVAWYAALAGMVMLFVVLFGWLLRR